MEPLKRPWSKGFRFAYPFYTKHVSAYVRLPRIKLVSTGIYIGMETHIDLEHRPREGYWILRFIILGFGIVLLSDTVKKQ